MASNKPGPPRSKKPAQAKAAPAANAKPQSQSQPKSKYKPKGDAKGARPAQPQPVHSKGKGAKPAPWLPDALPRSANGPATARASEDRRDAGLAGDPYAEREAARYEHPIPSREALIEFLDTQSELMTIERLGAGLGLGAERDLDALSKRLTAMVRDGQLLMNRRGGYGVARKLDLLAGTVLANRDGYGFLRPDSGSDDVFLPPATMRAVLHGDRVLVSVTGLDRRGRPEGQIVEVLERRSQRLVGRYEEQDGIGLVIPDDQRLHQDILIAAGQHGGARNGQIVSVEITTPPTRERPPLGRVISVLGEKLSASLTVKVAIESHGLPHEWPPAALEQAQAVSPEVSKGELDGREDLRALPLVTIDGEDARDFDDAVYAERRGRGWRLVVAIADVSHYVQPETALDEAAYERATSVYFPDFVVPMLPITLSNGICSLNPGVDRLCMVCDMQLDGEGHVTGSRFYPAVMHSHARLTYTQVWQVVGEHDEQTRKSLGPATVERLEALHGLYHLLAARRAERGAIEFDSQEFKFKLAASGEVLAMGAYARNDAHKLIEECMIAANVEAARFIESKHLPAPFRVHARPPESKYTDLLEFLKEFKLRLPSWADVTPADYRRLLETVRERPDAALLESVLLRSQSLAVYLPTEPGHFGLALESYAHFTSPIRRYPDLLVHRAIRHAVGGGRPGNYLYGIERMTAMAAHCSKCERRADEAERDVDERYKCAWMEKHIGSTFDGRISGVTSFGIFVDMQPSNVSGLVHVTQLPNDYYHFDATRKMLSGERRGLSFRLGDPVKVMVLRASLEDRKIDLRLVDAEGGAAGGANPAPDGAPRKRVNKPEPDHSRGARGKASRR